MQGVFSWIQQWLLAIGDFFAERTEVQDRLFFTLALALSLFGLVMVYSASSIIAFDKYQDSWFFFRRQLGFFSIGFFLMLCAISLNYRSLLKMGGYILAISLIALFAVHIPGMGASVGGATRWLQIAGSRFQPAEFAKLACIIYMAWALARKGESVKTFKYGLAPMALVAAVFAVALLLQPDFGNAVLLVSICGIMVFLAGGRISYLLGSVLLCAPAVWFLIVGEGYRKRRLLAFLDPWADPHNTSYQIVQSFTAFFSGGLWGQGLGNGREKLHYLPEVHTDFIVAVVGEELGYFTVVGLIAAFLLLVFRGYRVAVRAPDKGGFLLAAGCTSLLGLQAVLNFAVVMGVLPTKGLPLPFVSHGGSSLIISFIACGLILSVARSTGDQATAEKFGWQNGS